MGRPNLEQQLSAAKRVYGEKLYWKWQQLEAKLNQAKTTLKQFETSYKVFWVEVVHKLRMVNGGNQ